MMQSSSDRPLDTSLGAAGSTWRSPAGHARAGAISYQEKSLVLNSALDEYRRLRQAGQAVSAGEFCERFPVYRKSLLRLLDVENNLGDLGAIDDPFPDVGGSFLGFEILGELGVGAIARVYQASEPELGGRIVVIKVSAEGTAEAATLGKLQHPNIVQVHSVKRDAETGMTAVCMPYQGSATLTDVLDLVIRSGTRPTSSQGILEVARQMADMDVLQSGELATSGPDPVLVRGTFVDGIVHIGIQLAEALEYAHSAGVLHRDLKPSNVLLTPHGRPMLLDFNLSYDAAQETVPLGGTLPYMAPEQIRASLRREVPAGTAALDPRCDVYSLGAILYELMTGRLPYGGPPDQLGPEAASLWQLHALDTPPIPLRVQNPEVPSAVADVVERCLASSPQARPASMAEIAHSLRPHFCRSRRAARWLRRHPGLCRVAAAVVLLVTLAAGGYIAVRPPLHIRQYRFGVAALENKDYDRALEWTEPIIKSHPDLVAPRLLRGLAFEGKSNRREAASEFEKVARVADSAAVWDHLGCGYVACQRHVDAVACFAEAIRLVPHDAVLYTKAAHAAARDPKTFDRAESYATRAIELDPNSIEAHLVRGDVFIRNGSIDRAIADFRAAIAIAPNAVWIRMFTAERALIAADKYVGAREFMVAQVHQAVELGLSRPALLASTPFRLFQTVFAGLPERATGTLEPDRKFGDSMVPTLTLELPAG